MAYKYYTIQEICEWYSNNVERKLPSSLLEYMVSKGLIKKLANKHYSLIEINNFLLQKEDCDFIKNSEGKYLFKENRLPLLEKYKDELKKDNSKFSITKIDGNKLKLIKK